MHPLEDNKENFDRSARMYSPVKQSNMRRYKVLRDIVLQNRKQRGGEDGATPLKEKVVSGSKGSVEFKPLEFEDEAERKYGV